MTEQYAPDAEIWALFDAACDDALTADQVARLDAALRGDERLRNLYLDYFRLHAELSRSARLERAREKIIAAIRQPKSASVTPPIVLDLSPNTYYPVPSSYSSLSSWAFSYMVATVMVSVMLLGAWAYQITHYRQIADTPSVPSRERPELVFVGRITGMADCRWADPSTEAFAGASVPLGRKYALASGLMEISYITGAKVILQGPCTYEVESPAGGYLSLGKLTTKVGKERSEVRGQRSDHYPLSTIHYPLFSVRTPTAIVTDLGTEFGVEVNEEGNTTSHVFRGSVRVQVVGGTGLASGTPREEIVLRENESARVEKGAGKPSITRRAAADGSRFVMAMPPPKPVRDSKAYAELVLSLQPAVYYRMERPEKGTGPIGAKHPAGRSGQLDLSPFSRVFDSAPGGRHGELRRGNEFGSPYVPGRFGDALWLRGPAVCDRVVVPDYPKTTNDRLTVSAWVLATGRPGWATIVGNFGIFDVKHNQVGQFYLGLNRHDGDIFACVTQRNGGRARIREGASQPLPLYVWQHVALAADGSDLHLYRNGEKVATSPSAGGILPMPSVVVGLGVGCRLNNETGADADLDTPGYSFWQGRIDEVAIFNRALSAESIQELYLGKQLPDQTETTTKNTKGELPMNGP